MDMEKVLAALHHNVLCKSIFKKLDDASQEKLIECVKAAALSNNVEDQFFDCCDNAGLSDFGSLSLEENGILSASDIQVFGDELIKILKSMKK